MSNGPRIVLYLNQFFAGVGGEEVNDIPLDTTSEPIGPGRALQNILGDKGGTLVKTIFAGDDYFVSNENQAVEGIRAILEETKPDLVIAGPAYDAGRYGVACALVCKAAWDQAIPAVTGMHPDNSGLSAYRESVISVPTADNPINMAGDLANMMDLGLKLLGNAPLGPADTEGYLPTGLRHSFTRDNIAATRAVDMVLSRIQEKPFVSEVPARDYDFVDSPEPIKDLTTSTIAFITTAGVVPKGNPDQQSSTIPRRILQYNIESLDSLKVEDWESVHSGFKGFIYNTVNPNYAMPLPAFRAAEKKGLVGSIHPTVFSVVGGGCPVSEARRMGSEIARELKEEGVDAAVLAST